MVWDYRGLGTLCLWRINAIGLENNAMLPHIFCNGILVLSMIRGVSQAQS
jgi:hypothetical protein